MIRTLRLKIIIGSILLVMMLLVAAIMSIREFNRIDKSIDTVLKNNYVSVTLSRKMIEAMEQEEGGVLMLLKNNSASEDDINRAHTQMMDLLSTAKKNITEENEGILIEDIERMYDNAYTSVLLIMSQDYVHDRISIYNNTTSGLYIKVRSCIDNFMAINQDAIYFQSINAKKNIERALMPILVSIVCTILFVFLFSFFLNIYIIKPLKKITKEVKSFDSRKERLVTFTNTDDEVSLMIDEINNMIERLRVK